MTRKIRIALILLLTLCLASPLFARGYTSLDQAVEQARERAGGGRVIRAETRENNGQLYHNIRILTNDGKVRNLRIDAGEERRSNKRH